MIEVNGATSVDGSCSAAMGIPPVSRDCENDMKDGDLTTFFALTNWFIVEFPEEVTVSHIIFTTSIDTVLTNSRPRMEYWSEYDNTWLAFGSNPTATVDGSYVFYQPMGRIYKKDVRTKKFRLDDVGSTMSIAELSFHCGPVGFINDPSATIECTNKPTEIDDEPCSVFFEAPGAIISNAGYIRGGDLRFVAEKFINEGYIHANGMSPLSSNGTFVPEDVTYENCPPIISNGAGGSYGGIGANSTYDPLVICGYPMPLGPDSYGSETRPLDFGATGGYGIYEHEYNAGGLGGGRIFVSADVVELNREMYANGDPGRSVSESWSGAGSGGSIYVNGRDVNVRGYIRADGNTGPSGYNMASSGGRIAIYGSDRIRNTFNDTSLCYKCEQTVNAGATQGGQTAEQGSLLIIGGPESITSRESSVCVAPENVTPTSGADTIVVSFDPCSDAELPVYGYSVVAKPKSTDDYKPLTSFTMTKTIVGTSDAPSVAFRDFDYGSYADDRSCLRDVESYYDIVHRLFNDSMVNCCRLKILKSF
eukprot:TRINITY_DN6_c0_g1_i1.p1 TRINITY_DN6_c0_g1~~TRINITY_DN6_c0_g1_i1.p1  ORF type:complete len:565 (-),score=218.08 TRINITY_DN6_c0_g1_i1:993-2594(-)